MCSKLQIEQQASKISISKLNNKASGGISYFEQNFRSVWETYGSFCSFEKLQDLMREILPSGVRSRRY